MCLENTVQGGRLKQVETTPPCFAHAQKAQDSVGMVPLCTTCSALFFPLFPPSSHLGWFCLGVFALAPLLFLQEHCLSHWAVRVWIITGINESISLSHKCSQDFWHCRQRKFFPNSWNGTYCPLQYRSLIKEISLAQSLMHCLIKFLCKRSFIWEAFGEDEGRTRYRLQNLNFLKFYSQKTSLTGSLDLGRQRFKKKLRFQWTVIRTSLVAQQ